MEASLQRTQEELEAQAQLLEKERLERLQLVEKLSVCHMDVGACVHVYQYVCLLCVCSYPCVTPRSPYSVQCTHMRTYIHAHTHTHMQSLENQVLAGGTIMEKAREQEAMLKEAEQKVMQQEVRCRFM